MNISLRSALVSSLLISALFAGAQWSQVNSGLANLSQGAATHGASPTHLFARGGGNLFRSNNNGDSWTEVANPEFLNPSECGYYFADRYFAGLNSAQACIHYTDDEGDTWSSADGAPTATVVRGFFEYGGALYAYTSNAGIYRTIDGESWSAVNNGLTNLNVIGMCAAGPSFLAATVGGGVFRTIFADTWTQATGIAGGDLNGENIWYLGGAQYYTAQGGAIYRSTSLGETWTAWTAPPQFGLGVVEVKRFDTRLYVESRHFAGGMRDSVYMTTNGTVWENITGNLNAADLNGSGLLENNGYAFIAYNALSPGQGIYRYSISTGMEEQAMGSEPNVYPNPTEAVLTIMVPRASSSLNYTVIDAAGRTAMSGRMIAGTAQVDISALAPGSYIVLCDDPALVPVRVVKR